MERQSTLSDSVSVGEFLGVFSSLPTSPGGAGRAVGQRFPGGFGGLVELDTPRPLPGG